MTWTRLYAVALTLALSTSGSQQLWGGEGCAHCGCEAAAQKVCRLVCEQKKVKVTCWGCKCQDFCLPGKSCRGDKNCEMVCGTCKSDCSCDKPSAEPKKFVWFNWEPGSAQLDTKKKLMKKEVTMTVPSYKWVVEDLCASCEAKCESAVPPQGTPVPPVPQSAANAKLKYYSTAEDSVESAQVTTR